MTSGLLTTLYDSYKQFYMPTGKTYDTKKNIRSVISDVSKVNKDAPVYLLNNSKETKENLISVKENATELYYRLSRATGKTTGFNSIADKKNPYSSNNDLVSVEFTNNAVETENVEEYDIKVNSLATKQVNIGNYLKDNAKSFTPGFYSFDVKVDNSEYQFQFEITGKENNLDIQNKLERLFNRSKIGVNAEIINNGNGESALRLISEKEGTVSNEPNSIRFKFEEDNAIVNKLGLSNVFVTPKNANIAINGEEFAVTKNTFELEPFRITLNKKSQSENDIAHIGISTNTDSIAESVNEMTYGYNKFINSMSSKNTRITNEMKRVASLYEDNLKSVGITEKEGLLEIDQEKLKMAMSDPEKVGMIKDFSETLNQKANDISINPVKYIDKKIAAYKDPTKPHFPSPYVTNSTYSGMLLDAKY